MLSNHHFRHNCGDELKRKITACSDSHLRCLEKIKNEKINNAIIIEDDAVIDFKRLSELNFINEPCYIGGQIKSLKLKDESKFIKPEINIGFQKIEIEKYRISGAFGYYIPNYTDTSLFLKQHYQKRRGIDVEYMLEQKKGNLKHFIYPAIVKLYLPDAITGFSNIQMNLKDDLGFY